MLFPQAGEHDMVSMVTLLVLATLEPLPDIVSLEKKILDQRRGIVSGHVTLFTVTKGRPFGQAEIKVETWFDHNKIRRDDYFPSNKRQTVFSDKQLISWSEQRITATVSVNSNDAIHLKIKKQLAITHPRMLGMALGVEAELRRFGLESFVGAPNCTKTISKRKYRDTDCWVIRYQHIEGREYEVWSSLKHDCAVVKIDGKWGPRAPMPRRDVVESELLRSEKAGIWFPKRCVYRIYEKDKLVVEEQLRVTEASLNVSVDPKVFTVESLKLPKGTRVLIESPGRAGPIRRVWDGTKLAEP